jgi:hypothetical protein
MGINRRDYGVGLGLHYMDQSWDGGEAWVISCRASMTELDDNFRYGMKWKRKD